MSERLINTFAAFASTSLVLLFFQYTFSGRISGINFAFLPLVIIAITYTMLAVHQVGVAHSDPKSMHPFTHPVSFRWMLAIKYISFSVLLWWVVADFIWSMPIEPFLRRTIWLQAALVHVWFLRRFVVWDRPSVEESAHARDVRQEATDVRQDARDVTQDATERRQGGLT